MKKNDQDFTIATARFYRSAKMKHTECLSLSNYWVFLEKVILKVLEEADYRAILTFKLVRSVFLSVIVLSDTFQVSEL